MSVSQTSYWVANARLRSFCTVCGQVDGKHAQWCYDGRTAKEAAGKLVDDGAALLSADSEERKNMPIYSGVMRYFPRALAYIAKVSKAGNDKHNPGQPLHWSKDKSNDHLDCVARHLTEAGTVDPDDDLLHDGKLAWRALANLETVLEKRIGK